MIKEAAIKKDDVVYTGRRHNTIIGDKPSGFMKGGIQGFVTDAGIFMDRKQAARHAFLCGQIKEEYDTLLSEDLY